MKKLTIFALAIFSVLASIPYFSSAENQQTKQDTAFAGVYTLVTVNGEKVPATISHDDVKFKVSSGTFIIMANGTCISKMCFIPPGASEAVSNEVSATYKKEGSKLAMQWKGAGTTEGTLDGNSFSMDNVGMKLVYKK